MTEQQHEPHPDELAGDPVDPDHDLDLDLFEDEDDEGEVDAP